MDPSFRQDGVYLHSSLTPETEPQWIEGSLCLNQSTIAWKCLKNDDWSFAIDLRSLSFYDDSEKHEKDSMLQLHLVSSSYGYNGPSVVQLVFKRGGFVSFVRSLEMVLSRLRQQPPSVQKSRSCSTPEANELFVQGQNTASTGIASIEKYIHHSLNVQSERITTAFTDIKGLLKMAGEMVEICKSITKKLMDSSGEKLTRNEISMFRSYMTNLGVTENPVVKSGSGSNFHRLLCHEIIDLALKAMKDQDRKVIPMSEIYCCVNRVIEEFSVSPDDVVKACGLIGDDYRLRMQQLSDGSLVLELNPIETSKALKKAIIQFTSDVGSISIFQCANVCSVGVSTAKERLLELERCGELCRDLSIEGLRFYPNWFLCTK